VPGAQSGDSAVYLTIVNSTGQTDRYVSASIPIAGSVELQETIMQNGQAILRPLAEGILNGKYQSFPQK
jgi:copper(I)-binding protein